MNVNWKQKLSSRKFWALIAALGTSLAAVFGLSDDVTLQITGVISAVGSCAIYMLAEAYTDSNNNTNNPQ